MGISGKKLILRGIVISGVVLFSAVAGAQAASAESFFVDPDFDSAERDKITATEMYTGEKARFFVEDAYWGGLSSSAKASTLDKLEDMSRDFDSTIYPRVTAVFGSEWTPGIDGDPKVTVLITNMQRDIGGYFREDDEHKITDIEDSNEREMLYMNSDFLGNITHMKAFLTHEFQHLIHHNQRRRLRGVRSEVWINEMMSEAAPTIAGLNDTFLGSNLQSRVRTFLQNPSNDLTRWNNEQADYGIASVFGHYLLGHWGTEFFTALSESSENGISVVNDALDRLGSNKRFEDVFSDWVVASLVNDCNIRPIDTFCYANTDLTYDNLHISFSSGGEESKKISQDHTTYPWQGNWHSYSRAEYEEQPDDHVFVLTFNKAQDASFFVSYVVYPHLGSPEVYYLSLEGNSGKFYIEDFGNEYSEVAVMPVFQNFSGDTPLTNYDITAEVTTDVPPDATTSTLADENGQGTIPLHDGALVRAEGASKVYVVKKTPEGNQYRRWIQAGEIIDMYGHLRWEDVITIPRRQLDEYDEVTLIRYAQDPRVYSVSLNGHKRWIETIDEFFGLGYSFDMVYEVNELEFNFYLEL